MQAPDTLGQPDRRLDRYARGILPTALFVLVCLYGYKFGFKFGLWLASPEAKSSAWSFIVGLVKMIGGPPVLTLGILLTGAKDAMQFLPALRKVFRGEDWSELWAPGVAAFLSLFAVGIGIAAVLDKIDTRRPEIALQRTTVFDFGTFTMALPGNPKEPLLKIAVSFPEDYQSLTSSVGVTVDGNSRQFLERLGHALALCQGDQGFKAAIEIKGLASSSGPEDQGQYMKANLNAARLRAQNVKQAIVDGAHQVKPNDPLPIEIDDTQWPFEEMQQQIRFLDRFDGQYSDVLANLTRRAEVRVLSAGKCQVGAAETVARK
jgi:hypothetical protein